MRAAPLAVILAACSGTVTSVESDAGNSTDTGSSADATSEGGGLGACVFESVDSLRSDVIIEAPTTWRVFQRRAGSGTVWVTLNVQRPLSCLAYRLVGETSGPWGSTEALTTGGHSFQIPQVLPGQYRLEVRGVSAGVAGATEAVDGVGVGDVYVVAGQSNASFAGEAPQRATSGQVSFFDTEAWIECQDPVVKVNPNPNHKGGSPWCLLGDLLQQQEAVPVAFVPLAWSGSAIRRWQPAPASSPLGPGGLYQRVIDNLAALSATGGIRAVLWHQGESDVVSDVSSDAYASILKQLIDDTQSAAGQPVPWLVSEVSRLLPYAAMKPLLCPDPPLANDDTLCAAKVMLERQRVLDGQRQVVATHANAYKGIATDYLEGPQYRHDTVHFTVEALAIVAGLWRDQIARLPAP